MAVEGDHLQVVGEHILVGAVTACRQDDGIGPDDIVHALCGVLGLNAHDSPVFDDELRCAGLAEQGGPGFFKGLKQLGSQSGAVAVSKVQTQLAVFDVELRRLAESDADGVLQPVEGLAGGETKRRTGSPD